MRVILWVSSFILFLAGVEFGVRFDDWSRYGVSFLARETAIDNLVVRDSLGMHARPNSQYRGYSIDSLGFRGPNRSRDEMERALLIIATGASETFGLYETPGKEWPRQLEDSLASQCPVTPVLVLNAALAGMTLPTVTQDIDLRLSKLNPDIVLYYPSPVQYLDSRVPQAAAPFLGIPVQESRFDQELRVLPRLRDALKRLLPERALDLGRSLILANARKHDSHQFSVADTEDRLAMYERDLRQLIGTARAVGSEPVIVLSQNRFFTRDMSGSDLRWLLAWERFYPAASGELLLTFEDQASARTQLVGQDSGVLVVDPNLRSSGHLPEELFADFVHFTDLGSAVFAGAVGRGIHADHAHYCQSD